TPSHGLPWLPRHAADHDALSTAGPPILAGRWVPPRSQARPAQTITEYWLVQRDVPPPDAPAVERLRRGSFARRAAMGRGETATGSAVLDFPRHRVSRPVVLDDHPEVQVSADGTLAINASSMGVKQFYAAQEVVDRATRDLSAAGSKVTLAVDRGTYLDFEHDCGQRRLFRVIPEFRFDPTPVCRDFSEQVLGGGHTHAILYDTRPLSQGGTGVTVTALIDTACGLEIGGTHHLAHGLADVLEHDEGAESDSPIWASSLMHQARTEPPRDWPAPGQRYGKALNILDERTAPLRRRLAQESAKLGLNEFARPHVGEGYLMQSIGVREGGKRVFDQDHSHPGDRGMGFAQHPASGYHFAPVVIESLDGQHHIALESFYRRRDLAPLDAAIDQNLDHYADGLDQVELQLAAARDAGTLPADDPRLTLVDQLCRIRDAREELASVHEQLDHGGSGADQELTHRRAQAEETIHWARKAAHRNLLQIAGEAYGPIDDVWYFRMYGNAQGETFFEKLAPKDQPPEERAFVNPMAMVVVAGMYDQHLDLDYQHRSVEPDPDTRTRIDRLAGQVVKAGLWRAKQGLSLPDIRITSHAFPDELMHGAQRAAAVASLLRVGIDARLGQLQAHLPAGERISAEAFPIRTGQTVVRDPAALDEPPLGPIVRLDAFMQGDPAELADLTTGQLAKLAHQTGLHRAEGLLGKGRGRFTAATPEDIVRMRALVTLDRQLHGTGPIDVARLTDLRRAADILRREFGHTGDHLRPHDLDPLVRQVTGLDKAEPVIDRGRRNLVALIGQAKKPHRPVTTADLARARGSADHAAGRGTPASTHPAGAHGDVLSFTSDDHTTTLAPPGHR
ncbi:MAG: hypothetical protein ACJ786_10870, partial [Catenulispora sp.]